MKASITIELENCSPAEFTEILDSIDFKRVKTVTTNKYGTYKDADKK